MKRASIWILLVCALLCCRGLAAKPASEPVEYRAALDILALSQTQTAQGTPVVLRGVVTQSIVLGFTLQDSTAGIWVYTGDWGRFSQGDLLEVHGVVCPDLFSPAVRALSIRDLGRAPLPRPRPVSYREISSGDVDAQFVSITGEVRSMGVRSGNTTMKSTMLKIALPDGIVDADFKSANANDLRALVGAVVRIDAAAMCSKNANRQISSATLSVASLQNLTVLKAAPPDLFDLPLMPLEQLMQYRSGTNYFRRVRVAGTITYFLPGESLILQNGSQALLVRTAQAGGLQPGDQVEVVGTPRQPIQDRSSRTHSFGAWAAARRCSRALQPSPAISSGTSRYNLLSVTGLLVRRVEEPGRVVFLVQEGSSLLLAELDKNHLSPAVQRIQEGSTICTSGIAMLDVEGTWNYGVAEASAVRAKLLLRSSADIQLIQPPSWWTTAHVIYLAVALALLMLASLALSASSRIEQWKLRAVLEERERLAQEIHDTLAQSFAGIAFQLQAVRRALLNGLPALRAQVDLSLNLVRHSHKEARQSIEPLHSKDADAVDLLQALDGLARKMVEACNVEVSASMCGEARLLPPRVSAALLRIGQEALANAIRHADPQHIEIILSYEPKTVCLRVIDDGSGFTMSGDLLGFGLRGMRKRAAAISAKLAVTSQPGKGTRVEARAPAPPLLSVLATLKKAFHILRRTTSY
jgi:signal transduction histidine kinase